jgi:hypothetical protein
VDKTAYLDCPKCGAQIPVNDVSAKCHEDESILFVHYDPAYTTVVLINAESGVKHTVNLSYQETPPKPASRQIAGIIGPY